MLQPIVDLTIAVATLNRPHGLVRCLDGVFSGCALPAQVVVVDQSQDRGTQDALARYRAIPIPIVYVRQRRRGLSASRNAAIGRARCPVVCMMDDDCVPAPGWVAAIAQTFASANPPEALAGRILPLGPNAPGLYAISPRAGLQRTDFQGPREPWLVGSGGNFAVRLACLERLGPYDERLGAGSPGQAAEDMDYIYRLLRAGGRIRYEPEALIYHERQTRRKRLATRSSYGFGMGAFCGKWIRRHDRYAARILRRWLHWQAQELLAGARTGDWAGVHERGLSLQGTARGLLYGLRLPVTPTEATA
jgi:glycosyltransferase involved in cell wall biosynthesis